MGNAADSGSGGGLRLQNINGTDVITFPTRQTSGGGNGQIQLWNSVSITNNIITNNVAGWDGAGISLLDALDVNIVNNTIASNDTTASAGVLFNTIGAPLASATGLADRPINRQLRLRPAGHLDGAARRIGQHPEQRGAGRQPSVHGHVPGRTLCRNHRQQWDVQKALVPAVGQRCALPEPGLPHWNRRSWSGGTSQQNVVTLYNGFTTTPAPSQTATGSCPTASYWDIGVRGDTSPTTHESTVTLNPTYSFLTNATGYAASNSAANPTFVSKYCNGSRIPPEFGGTGFQVPPGISDATVPNPVFSLTPAATVDEGNNWINISWGPLAVANPLTNATLGNYAQSAGSPVNSFIPSTATANYAAAPSTDFFGNPRKTNNAVDAGAVEYVATGAAVVSVTPTSLVLPNTVAGATSASSATYQVTVTNNGGAAFTGLTATFTGPFSRGTGDSCTATLAGGANCAIRVLFHPTVAGPATGTLAITGSVAVTGSPVSLSGTGIAAVISATLTPTSRNFGTVTRNCPTPALACGLDPTQVFTLTNTGNAPLTGIAQGVLAGLNANEFTVRRALSTCGPAGGGQLLANTTLNPGASCVITVYVHAAHRTNHRRQECNHLGQ